MALRAERTEDRVMLSHVAEPQLPLPTKVGQEFMIDDFDNDVTTTQLGLNYFQGNNGTLGDSIRVLSADSKSPVGSSLHVQEQAGQSYGGFFTTLFGRPVVDVPQTILVPNSTLDLQDIYSGFAPSAGLSVSLANKSVEQLKFDIKHNMSESLKLRIELKDANSVIKFVQNVTVAETAGLFKTVSVTLPGSLLKVQTLTVVVEDNIHSVPWDFLLDDVRFVDTNGTYPDLAQAADTNDSLKPQLEEGFLDWVRKTSSLYFVDFASHFSGAGGIVQDRSTFPDLMTVGGAGFQITSYVIDAERGYVTKAKAATLVSDLLRVLNNEDGNHPMGDGASGTIGFEGFFYHFVSIAGLRKDAGVEVSTIDTALALAGVLTAAQYFKDDPDIVRMANDISSRVNWQFMRFQQPDPNLPHFSQNNQFFLGWNPTSKKGFEFPNPNGPGFFSSHGNDPSRPLTLDVYTDEALLVALLAMASPNPTHQAGREAWDSIERIGAPFVKSFPGSLFTYQFFSVWVDTQSLGEDNHMAANGRSARPLNFYENTQTAIQTTRQYAMDNTSNRATWQNGTGATRWGITAGQDPIEFRASPTDDPTAYFADAAPTAAIDTGDPREVGSVAVYGVGSSIVHEPQLALASLFATAREDLNRDGKSELLHPRFGFADKFNLDVQDVMDRPGTFDTGLLVRPTDDCSPGVEVCGPWANFDGYAIDHGPMLIMIDNYLEHNFVPHLFMSDPNIHKALLQLFPRLVPPVITAPPAVTPFQRPTISWTPVSGASEYEIWVTKNPGTNPYHQVTVMQTSYAPPTNFGIGKFNLWVRAKFGDVVGPWSLKKNFIINTQAVLQPIARLQPTLRPTINWDVLPGAVKYDIWVNDVSRGFAQYIRNMNVTGTSFTPSADLPLAVYGVWVRGIAADGTAGAWSGGIEFLTMQAPTITQGQNPTFDRTPAFAWNALPGAAKYEVFIRNRNTGATTLHETNIASLNFTPSTPISDGPYRWWAIGVSAQGVRSFWTAPMDIYIGGRTDLLTPLGSTSDRTPTFSWRPVDGAVRYDLFVDLVGGQTQIIRQQNLTGTNYTPTNLLSQGNYRAWIRAVSNTGEVSPWSIQVDFSIAAVTNLSHSGFSPQDSLLSLAVLDSTPVESNSLPSSAPRTERSVRLFPKAASRDSFSHRNEQFSIFPWQSWHRHQPDAILSSIPMSLPAVSRISATTYEFANADMAVDALMTEFISRDFTTSLSQGTLSHRYQLPRTVRPPNRP